MPSSSCMNEIVRNAAQWESKIVWTLTLTSDPPLNSNCPGVKSEMFLGASREVSQRF